MKEKIIEAIAKCARERWFLLNLKAKFTGTGACMYSLLNEESVMISIVCRWPILGYLRA